MGLSEPSSRVPSTGNESLLPQQGGSVPVRGTSMRTRTNRFGNAPGCAHVWGTVPANTTQCIGAKSAPRLKCCAVGWCKRWYTCASKQEQMPQTQDAQTYAARDTYASVQASQPASQPASSAFRQITLAYHALLSALDMQLTNFIYKLWAALLAEGPVNTHAHTPVMLHSYMVSIRNC